MPRHSDKIAIKPKAEDLEWLAAQAESLGLDEPALALAALVRWARLNGVTLGVASNVGQATYGTGPMMRELPLVREENARRREELIAAEANLPELADATPTNEADIDAMVASRVNAALATGALDSVLQPAPSAPQATVVPLMMRERRGYLLGSTAVPG